MHLVLLGVDGDGADAELGAGAEHANGDLAPVGHEYALDRLVLGRRGQVAEALHLAALAQEGGGRSPEQGTGGGVQRGHLGSFGEHLLRYGMHLLGLHVVKQKGKSRGGVANLCVCVCVCVNAGLPNIFQGNDFCYSF